MPGLHSLRSALAALSLIVRRFGGGLIVPLTYALAALAFYASLPLLGLDLDAGTSGAVGPNLDESMPDNELVLDRVTNGQGGMPAFSSTLTEQQIADVAAYVSSAAGS